MLQGSETEAPDVRGASAGNATRTGTGGAAGAALASDERLLTVREVAEHLQVSRATVYKLIARGELPHVRVSNAIRVAPAVLGALIQARR